MTVSQEWREQYDRMGRAIARVRRHYAGNSGFGSFGPFEYWEFADDVWHAFQDVFNLRDWIKNDPQVAISRAVVEGLFTDDPQGFPNLHLVRDVANGSKHLVLNDSASISKDAKVARTGHVSVTLGREMTDAVIAMSIAVEIDASRRKDALDLLMGAVAEWDGFLRQHALLP